MSHSFSISYVKEMEIYLDANFKTLRGKISEFASNNQTFDLKKSLHYYVIDTLGELALAKNLASRSPAMSPVSHLLLRITC
jgi:hypothetical protein